VICVEVFSTALGSKGFSGTCGVGWVSGEPV
jgi:hypothetical protein